MEEKIKRDLFENSINIQNEINNYNIQGIKKEKYIPYKEPEFNYYKNKNDLFQNGIKDKNFSDKIDNSNKNNIAINKKREIFKKFKNLKVNRALKDIYGVIANINEVNKKVNKIISHRPILPKYKSADSKMNNIKDDKNSKSFREATDENYKINNNIIKEYNNKNNLYLNSNCSNNIASKTVTSGFLSSKYSNDINNNITMNKSIVNSELSQYNSNNSNKKRKYGSFKFHKYFNFPQEKGINKELKTPIQKNSNIKYISSDNIYNKNDENNSIYNEDESNYLIESTSKTDEISKTDKSSTLYEEDNNHKLKKIHNDTEIKYIKLKLRNEEKKLKDLEKEKNKLLKEEKLRKKVLMKKEEEHDNSKKESLIKEYKKKINLIKKLQACNVNEIIQLEKQKRIDQKRLKRINILCNEDNINKHLLKMRKNKYRNKPNILREKKIDFNNNINCQTERRNENEKDSIFFLNKNNLNFHSFSNRNPIKYGNTNKLKDYINTEDNLMSSYKYINSLYELTNSKNNSNNVSLLTNNLKNLSNKKTNNNLPKKIFDNLVKYENKDLNNNKENLYSYNNYLNNDNDNNIKEYKNYEVSEYIMQHNNNINRRNCSDLKKYDKKRNNNINTKLYKKYVSSNIEIPSFIQSRVNKYNYSKSRDSSISKRVSNGKMVPFILHYNQNFKYGYNMTDNDSLNTEKYFSHRNEKRGNKGSIYKKKDLNYKSIFFNND